MWELLKRLFVFIIGLYFIMFFIRVIFDGSSLSSTFGSFAKALSDVRTFNQGIMSGNNTSGTSTKSVANSKYLTSSKGASTAVSFTNFSSGNTVSSKEPILGSIKSSWLYDGVTTARFLDESGNQIGVAQVVEDGISAPNSETRPFSIYPNFKQGNVKTGYMVIEKANNTGKSTNDAWYTIHVTYPTVYSPEQNTSSSTNGVTTWSTTRYDSIDNTDSSSTSSNGVTTWSSTRNVNTFSGQ